MKDSTWKRKCSRVVSIAKTHGIQFERVYNTQRQLVWCTKLWHVYPIKPSVLKRFVSAVNQIPGVRDTTFKTVGPHVSFYVYYKTQEQFRVTLYTRIKEGQ